MGSFYVNDFNVFGRIWQVNVQAETPFRNRIDDINRIYVRNAQGTMVPIRALAQAKLVQGPQAVVRYNGYRAAIVNGAAKPGFSSGQALAAMEHLRFDPADRATASNGPAPRSRKRPRAAETGIVLGLAVSSPICFSSRFMRAGISPFRYCSRSASRCSAR